MELPELYREYERDPREETLCLIINELARLGLIDVVEPIIDPFKNSQVRKIYKNLGLSFKIAGQTPEQYVDSKSTHGGEDIYAVFLIDRPGNDDNQYNLAIFTVYPYEEDIEEYIEDRKFHSERINYSYVGYEILIDIKEGQIVDDWTHNSSLWQINNIPEQDDCIKLYERSWISEPEEAYIMRGQCEDYPACGHDYCPPRWSHSGEQVAMVCTCGALVPLESRYSLCDTCLRSDPDDYGYAGYDYDGYDYDDEPEGW